jgi:hypothetical protein
LKTRCAWKCRSARAKCTAPTNSASPRTGPTSRATRPDGQVGWLRDLIEIVDASHDAEELLEHTKLAIYQDRIFAFTPKGALHQLAQGSTPVDFAYAVHTDLGDRAVGAKINGRHMPLRTLNNAGRNQWRPAWSTGIVFTKPISSTCG